MHVSRTTRRTARRPYRQQPSTHLIAALEQARLNCPYCVWFLLGLGLMVSMPGLGAVQTPVGALWLWLLLLPLASALLRRLLLR